MDRNRAARLVLVALALAPARAWAGEFDGLAAIVAGMFVGAPLLVILAAFVVASIVIGGRGDVRPRRRRFAWIAIGLSAAAAPLYVVATLILDSSKTSAVVAVVLSLPLLAMAAASIALAARVLRKNPKG